MKKKKKQQPNSTTTVLLQQQLKTARQTKLKKKPTATTKIKYKNEQRMSKKNARNTSPKSRATSVRMHVYILHSCCGLLFI